MMMAIPSIYSKLYGRESLRTGFESINLFANTLWPIRLMMVPRFARNLNRHGCGSFELEQNGIFGWQIRHGRLGSLEVEGDWLRKLDRKKREMRG
jgi:hypothetical protein